LTNQSLNANRGMMTMKLGKMTSTQFTESFKKLMEMKLPVKTMFKLKKISKLVTEETQNYYDTMNSYLKEYAIKDEDGNPLVKQVGTQTMVNIVPGKIEEYNGKFKELNDVEIEFDGLTFSDFGSEETNTLTTMDLTVLEFITERNDA